MHYKVLWAKGYYKEGKKGFDDNQWDIYEPETYTRHTISFAPKNGKKKTATKVYTGESIKADFTLTAKWEKAPKKDTIYVVKKGDTIAKIAKKYNTTVGKIVKDNGIKNANKISIGQKLKV